MRWYNIAPFILFTILSQLAGFRIEVDDILDTNLVFSWDSFEDELPEDFTPKYFIEST